MERPIAVLGAGSWGTALAWLLAGKGAGVRLWGRDAPHLAEIETARENARYLPALKLPGSLSATADLERALDGAGLVVAAVPSSAVRETLSRALPHMAPDASVALAAKGLERFTGKRLSEVAAEELGEARSSAIAVLSGPNLSGEIVRKLPTAAVVASLDDELARALQETFATPFFRMYANRDVTGVELGGALKNPIAVAAGICEGLGFGANTKATLLTRGLAEMTRLGVAAGARAATFSGLSGLGDLVATANSPLSRNYRLGCALGRGESVQSAAESLHQVSEGVPTTEAACRLAAHLGVEVPIFEELRRVMFEGKPPAEAVAHLMTRPYKEEGEE